MLEMCSSITGFLKIVSESLISGIVDGGIFGLGANGYILAINAMHELLNNGN